MLEVKDRVNRFSIALPSFWMGNKTTSLRRIASGEKKIVNLVKKKLQILTEYIGEEKKNNYYFLFIDWVQELLLCPSSKNYVLWLNFKTIFLWLPTTTHPNGVDLVGRFL